MFFRIRIQCHQEILRKQKFKDDLKNIAFKKTLGYNIIYCNKQDFRVITRHYSVKWVELKACYGVKWLSCDVMIANHLIFISVLPFAFRPKKAGKVCFYALGRRLYKILKDLYEYT